MCQLFGRERSVITKHIRNVFREGELDEQSVCAKFAHTAGDGKTYQVSCYNLDVVISVGYRVKSSEGVRFGMWANGVLKSILMHRANDARFLKELERRLADHEDPDVIQRHMSPAAPAPQSAATYNWLAD